MGRYVRWITHEGVKMLFVNCNSLPEADVAAAVVEMKQEFLKERYCPPTLLALTKMGATLRVLKTLREADAAIKATGIPEGPVAMVGLMPLQKKEIEFTRRERHYEIYCCDTVVRAKDWLARKAGERSWCCGLGV